MAEEWRPFGGRHLQTNLAVGARWLFVMLRLRLTRADETLRILIEFLLALFAAERVLLSLIR